jgi:hypothetical protein
MERYFSTGQSPHRAVTPTEEEEFVIQIVLQAGRFPKQINLFAFPEYVGSRFCSQNIGVHFQTYTASYFRILLSIYLLL